VIVGLLLISNFWRWLRHLGGPGLVLLGLADNSFIPVPGSMDVLTIWLSVHHRDLWWYYALMATAGAVLGGYLTYRLAWQGGKQAIERRLGPRRSRAFYRRFERWGFWSVAVPALLPPPFPFVPFLLVAGALQYSRGRFLAALALGRGVRYTLVAALGLVYGSELVRFFNRNTKPTVYVLVGLAVAASVVALIRFSRLRRRAHSAGKASVNTRRQRA
jgi:membrane protein YqaA with SNARE-associated domain